MKINERLKLGSLLVLILLLPFFRASLLPAQARGENTNPPKSIPLYTHWDYLKGTPSEGQRGSFPEKAPGNELPWRPFEKLTIPEQETGLDFWFRHTLPTLPWSEASYLIQADAPAFAVYLDSTRIYTYGNVLQAPLGKPEGLSFHSIPLPLGSSGRNLTLWLPNTRAYELTFWRSMVAARSAIPKATRSLLAGFLVSDLIGLILGGMFSIIGLGVVVFYILRGRWKDLAVLSFGIYALLCGLSFLPASYIVQFLFPTPNWIWWEVSAVIGYLIPIPVVLFIIQLVGKGWRSTLLWILGLTIAYSAIGLVLDFSLQFPNSILRESRWGVSLVTFVFLLVILANLFRPGQKRSLELAILRAGFSLFALAIVASHLIVLRAIPLRIDPSPFGNFLFVCCVGYLAAKNFMSGEKKLATIEHELQTARRIQSAILPQKAPQVPGLDIAMRYIPTSSVAGDFYDFLVLDQTRLGILVADVSGHGVPAALIASMVKAAYTTQMNNASNPARLLSDMNQALISNPEGQFITAACLYLDIGLRKMVYAGAGHPPLFIWRRREKRFIEFSNNGLIMGPFPEASYENAEMALMPGDRFILYTDGVTETMNSAGDQFGDERLKEFIRSRDDLPVGGFADAFIANLLTWSGKKVKALDDDLTMLVVDFAGQDN